MAFKDARRRWLDHAHDRQRQYQRSAIMIGEKLAELLRATRGDTQ
jgi:hypothetical protein